MPGYAGFDADIYPGDDVMSWLRANTNLVWCGYYLGGAPSHPDMSWMGNRAALAANGWGIAPIYVGQQVIPPGSLNPSAATGVQDGTQAVSMMQNEGFASGSYVYLDLENGPPLPQSLQDYVTNWINAVASGGFGPGVYCSHLLAQTICNLFPSCRIWAFKVSTTATHPVAAPFPDSDPAGCGCAVAHAWQLDQNGVLSLHPATQSPLGMDSSSAVSADPGAPDS
jgi:hypothetical protein